MIFCFDIEVDVEAQDEEEAIRIMDIVCDVLDKSERIKGTAFMPPYLFDYDEKEDE